MSAGTDLPPESGAEEAALIAQFDGTLRAYAILRRLDSLTEFDRNLALVHVASRNPDAFAGAFLAVEQLRERQARDFDRHTGAALRVVDSPTPRTGGVA